MQTTFYENLILILQFKMFILQFNLSSWVFIFQGLEFILVQI